MLLLLLSIYIAVTPSGSNRAGALQRKVLYKINTLEETMAALKSLKSKQMGQMRERCRKVTEVARGQTMSL